MKNESVKVLVGTVSGLLVGGLAGFYISKKVLSKQFDELLDTEVEKVKKFYKDKYEAPSEEDNPDVEVTVEVDEDVDVEVLEDRKNHAQIISDNYYKLHPPKEEEEVEVEPMKPDPNYSDKPDEEITGFIMVDPDKPEVFDENYVPPPLMEGGPIDYKDPEVKNFLRDRDTSVPYLITVDEFMEDREEFDKQAVTYFEGDDSLCDDRDMLIEDIERNIGRDNLEYFGRYSRDSNIVYVRNERISVDFEIAYDPRTYVEAIAGFKFRKVLKKEDD